jgi:hypothetical protein
MEWLSDDFYIVDENGCWIWQRSRNSKGYGVKWDPRHRRLDLAHRLYYERAYGPIAEGLQIDHLCTVKACVRPSHLEAVSQSQNMQRMLAGKPRKPVRIREAPIVREVDPAECVLWAGHLDRYGYGIMSRPDGRRPFAHRWAYEQVHGLIPAGLTIDHLCRNRACVNVSHLEAVTQAENNKRATWRQACKHGHQMTPENTLWEPTGQRRCRICKSENQRRHWERKKARKAAAKAARRMPASPESDVIT